jgi:hypothetical protein
MTARRHSQHPGGVPADAGKPAPVAAKAAAIDAEQARPLTWKTVVKRALVVAVAGAAVYLVLPQLMAVLGSWPRLSTLNPTWFTRGRRRRPVQHAHHRGVRYRHRRRRPHRVLPARGRRPAGATTVRTAHHPGRRSSQPRARPYRPARCRRVRPVRCLRRDHPAHRLAAGSTRARGAEPVEPAHPRPAAAADRPRQAAANRTRHDQVSAGQEMVAGDPADRRPARLRLLLPARRAARHRSRTAALPGAAWPTPPPTSSRCSRSPRAGWASWRQACVAC